MNTAILLYNFSPERENLAKKAFLPFNCTVKCVCEQDQIQTIGFMLGEKGFKKNEACLAQRVFKDELMVISGIGGEKLSLLLMAVKSVGLGKINYKALVTDTNINWTGIQLFDEIKKEHSYFNSN